MHDLCGSAECPPCVALHGSHLLAQSAVYLNMLLRHVGPRSIFRSASVAFLRASLSLPPLHYSEASAS